MALAAIAMLVFDEEIARLFTRESEVLFHAVNCLQILAYGYGGWSFGMAVIQAFNGAVDTITPTFINVLCVWIIQMPLPYCLALTLGWSPAGVFWAVFIADNLTCVLGVLAFRRGRWRPLVVEYASN